LPANDRTPEEGPGVLAVEEFMILGEPDAG
jgi:hypothetical protein